MKRQEIRQKLEIIANKFKRNFSGSTEELASERHETSFGRLHFSGGDVKAEKEITDTYFCLKIDNDSVEINHFSYGNVSVEIGITGDEGEYQFLDLRALLEDICEDSYSELSDYMKDVAESTKKVTVEKEPEDYGEHKAKSEMLDFLLSREISINEANI